MVQSEHRKRVIVQVDPWLLPLLVLFLTICLPKWNQARWFRSLRPPYMLPLGLQPLAIDIALRDHCSRFYLWPQRPLFEETDICNFHNSNLPPVCDFLHCECVPWHSREFSWSLFRNNSWIRSIRSFIILWGDILPSFYKKNGQISQLDESSRWCWKEGPMNDLLYFVK